MSKEKKHTLHKLYIELVKLQKEIISSGFKLILILEGRDAAGKDGTVKAITKHLSPRDTRVVALGAPSSRESNEWYFQRFSFFLPAKGEFVIFNRSWYNRAGVERVMNFCTDEEYRLFFQDVELFERMLVDSGFIILKYYLDISKKEQKKRLNDRKNDPLKQWKISAIDEKAHKLWKEYSEARNIMLLKTSFTQSPWYIADAEDKDDFHVALISHLLSQVHYRDKNEKLIDKDYGLIYPATTHNIENKLYK